jgi:hypothetical protein
MAEEQVDRLPVDFDRLPDELQPLVPFIREWGVADDADRESQIERASDEDLRALVEAFSPHWDAINGWLDERDADPDRYEASVLSAASEAAMEAQMDLDRRASA